MNAVSPLPKTGTPLLRSFFMGGFECATHRRRDRRRIDVIAATHHDECAHEDYTLLQRAGIFTVRDGLRWHLIERVRGRYQWQSFLPQLQASIATGTQVIWDLCHWGVPAHLDIFSPVFIEAFAQFSAAAAAVVRQHSDAIPLYCPINEISFWSWVGGEVKAFYPHASRRGPELKRHLVAASLAARAAVLEVDPRARFVQAEPVIHISAKRPRDVLASATHTASQFEAWDMLRDGSPTGTMPDIIGVNFYWNNQWIHNGERTPIGHHQHRPLHEMLLETWQRYHRPIVITETGAEAGAARGWLAYICAEVREAQRYGAEIAGICLYPVMDYPGWDNARHCSCGLIALDESWRQRTLRPGLAAELAGQRSLFNTDIAQG